MRAFSVEPALPEKGYGSSETVLLAYCELEWKQSEIDDFHQTLVFGLVLHTPLVSCYLLMHSPPIPASAASPPKVKLHVIKFQTIGNTGDILP
uniref:Uncharacterized protein n=1 Tax=Angiostrongylus cantonensis TaxID=6313 RepID=A0A0K0CTR3_ANGCA